MQTSAKKKSSHNENSYLSIKPQIKDCVGFENCFIEDYSTICPMCFGSIYEENYTDINIYECDFCKKSFYMLK